MLRIKEYSKVALYQYLAMVLNFSLQIVLTSLLEPRVFGLYAKVFAVREVFSAFVSFSFAMGIIYVQGYSKEVVATNAMVLALIQAGIILVAYLPLILITSLLFNFELYENMLLLLMVISYAMTVIQQMIYSLAEKEEKFKSNSYIVLWATIAVTIFTVVTALFDQSILSLMFRELFSALLLLCIYLVVLKKNTSLSLSWSLIDKKLISEILKYSSKMYFARLTEALFGRLDILLMSFIFNLNQLGVYERIKYFATLPQVLITSLINRINLVKYSKSLRFDLLYKTNFYGFIASAVSFFMFYLLLVLIGTYFRKELSTDIFPLFFCFWAFAGFGTIIENVKTFYYANNMIIMALVRLKILPLLVFTILFLILFINKNYLLEYYALSISFAIFSSFIVTNIKYIKFDYSLSGIKN